MEFRNLRAVLREKELTLAKVARLAGCQVSLIELIMIGAFVPGIDLRIRICNAIGEPFSNELFETGLKDHMTPIK